MFWINFGLTLLAIILSSCMESEDYSETRDYEIPSPSINDKVRPGAGWNSDKEIITGRCLEGDLVQVGSQQSSVVYSADISREELYNSIGYSFSAKAKGGLYSGSASAQFAATNSEDKFSSVTIFSAQYRFNNLVFEPTGRLSSIGESIALKNRQDHWAWASYCGDEYISQTIRGAQLIYSARIDFLTQEDKEAFNASFGVKGPAFSVKANLEKASRNFASKASVTISAYQLGGDTSQITTAFSGQKEDGGQPIIRCSMAAIEPCLEVLENLIDYASKEDRFPSQIKNNGEGQGGADLIYLTKPYGTAGVFMANDKLLRKLLQEQRRDIESKLDRNVLLRNRFKFLQNLPNYENNEEISQMKIDLEEAIKTNSALISDAISQCFDDIYIMETDTDLIRTNCNRSVNKLNSSFIDLSNDRLNLDEYSQSNCAPGHKYDGYGCEPVECKGGYLFGEIWKSDLFESAGVAEYQCGEEGSPKLIGVSCENTTHYQPLDDKGHEILECLPKPCSPKIKHGDVWTEAIANGSDKRQCRFGEEKSIHIVCNEAYEFKDGRCQEIKTVPKFFCHISPKKKIAVGQYHFEKACHGDKYMLFDYECRIHDTKTSLFKTREQVIGTCGLGGSYYEI